jgi:hypothetical protein
MAKGSTLVILVALAGNLAIAIAKFCRLLDFWIDRHVHRGDSFAGGYWRTDLASRRAKARRTSA